MRLRRGARQVRKQNFKDRGSGVGTVAVRRVGPGRYSVRVGAADAAGLESRIVVRKVVVRRAVRDNVQTYATRLGRRHV